MADVSVKMGVSGVSQFKAGMQQAQASVKSIDAALKLNEKQFKATGDAEAYMQNKTTQLNAKLNAQQSAVKNAEQALKAMKDAGVDPLSAAYQKMETAMLNAQSAVLDTQEEINGLGVTSAESAKQVDSLAAGLGGLNKKVSLEQVRGAITSITSGLERGAKKAAELATNLWNTIMDSAKRADDTATMAEMYGIDLQEFKRMQALVANGMDTSVEAILSAQDKLKRGVGNGTEAVKEQLRELGLLRTVAGKYDNFETVPAAAAALQDFAATVEELVTSNPEELFWKAGQAIMEMGDAFDKEAAAQAVFGRGWKELVPLFNQYHSLEEYRQALDEVNISSEDSTKNMVELNDKVSELENTWTTLKDEIIGQIAPALSGAAEALNGVLTKVLEYLQTPEGKQALEDMGKAVEGLFKDITKIDPDQVVASFKGVFDDIVGGLQWLSSNSGTVIGSMQAIVAGWAMLKLTGGALDILKLINGIQGLGGAAAGAGAASAGASSAGAASAGAAGAGAAGAGAAGAGTAGAATAGLAGKIAAAATTAAPILLMAAAGYAGAKMIEANLNDPDLNAIYGDRNGNDTLIDTMSDSAAEAAREYWNVYEKTGTDAAIKAREKLEKALAGEGYYHSELGVDLIEDIFDSMLKENDISGEGAKLFARWAEQPGNATKIRDLLGIPKEADAGLALSGHGTRTQENSQWLGLGGEWMLNPQKIRAISGLEKAADGVQDIYGGNGQRVWTGSRATGLGPMAADYNLWKLNRKMYGLEAELGGGVLEPGGINWSRGWHGNNALALGPEVSDNVFGMTREQFNAVQDFYDFMRENSKNLDTPEFDQAMDNYEKAFEGQEELFNKVDELMNDFIQSRNDGTLPEDIPEDIFKVTAEPELADDAESNLQGMLDRMNLSAVVAISPALMGMTFRKHANGLPFVPFDGYPAILHRGERVMTAGENKSYTYNNNTYFGSVNLHNGLEVDALTESIDRRNQRMNRGYGA